MFFDVLISLFVATIIVALGTVLTILIVKTTIGKMAAVAVVVMLVLFSVALATGHAEETRRVEVIGFDFLKAEVVLVDEDGYLWTCPFGKSNWEIGEEYELFIPDEGQPEIKELP